MSNISSVYYKFYQFQRNIILVENCGKDKDNLQAKYEYPLRLMLKINFAGSEKISNKKLLSPIKLVNQ